MDLQRRIKNTGIDKYMIHIYIYIILIILIIIYTFLKDN